MSVSSYKNFSNLGFSYFFQWLYYTVFIVSFFISARHILISSDDVVYSDTWSMLHIIENAIKGSLSFSDLWSPFNQNRPVFLHLIMIISSFTDDLNIHHLQLLSPLFAVFTILLISKLCRPLFKEQILTYYLMMSVVSFCLFSLSQWENYLLAINVVFFSTVTFSVSAILSMVLCLERGNRWFLFLSIVCSVMATISMGGGLIIWPVTSLYIIMCIVLVRRIYIIEIFTYVLFSIIAIWFYSKDLSHGGSFIALLKNPIQAIHYSLIGLGGSLTGFFSNQANITINLINGTVIAVFLILGLFAAAKMSRGQEIRVLAVLSLMIFGIAEQCLITMGRLPLGLENAASSRYSTLVLLAPTMAFVLAAVAARSGFFWRIAVIIFGLFICGLTVRANNAEMNMAIHRYHYVQNLRQVIERGDIGQKEADMLQWYDAEKIRNSIAILRRYKLSQFSARHEP